MSDYNPYVEISALADGHATHPRRHVLNTNSVSRLDISGATGQGIWTSSATYVDLMLHDLQWVSPGMAWEEWESTRVLIGRLMLQLNALPVLDGPFALHLHRDVVSNVPALLMQGITPRRIWPNGTGNEHLDVTFGVMMTDMRVLR